MQPASFAMLLILGRRDPASLTSLAREEMRTIDADLTIGVAGAVRVGKLLSSVLFQTGTRDPIL